MSLSLAIFLALTLLVWVGGQKGGETALGGLSQNGIATQPSPPSAPMDLSCEKTSFCLQDKEGAHPPYLQTAHAGFRKPVVKSLVHPFNSS